ncbi:MAG: GNAT family N-acetyltransferase [Treponema sp.]|jgi:ribosomal protein S18 acetylase RimI-like enzyme|nr:GNAT family N-acetyltransferase [Treponema sp.]
MTTIRNVQEVDIPYLYDICLKTGDAGSDASKYFSDPYLLGHYYAAPYVFFDQKSCFVVTSNSVPKGYIVATTDTVAFNAWMESTWLAMLRERYSRTFSILEHETALISLIHRKLDSQEPWFDQYPAHGHIDLLPEIQGKGYGKKLMETLFSYLRERNVPGIHLGVAGQNKGAIAFYNKMNFSVIKEELWGFILGRYLNGETVC